MSAADMETTSDVAQREHCAAVDLPELTATRIAGATGDANKPVFTPCRGAINSSPDKVGAPTNRGGRPIWA
jgi:hypothetical protein